MQIGHNGIQKYDVHMVPVMDIFNYIPEIHCLLWHQMQK